MLEYGLKDFLPYISDKNIYRTVMQSIQHTELYEYYGARNKRYCDMYNADINEVFKYINIAKNNMRKRMISDMKSDKTRWFYIFSHRDSEVFFSDNMGARENIICPKCLYNNRGEYVYKPKNCPKCHIELY